MREIGGVQRDFVGGLGQGVLVFEEMGLVGDDREGGEFSVAFEEVGEAGVDGGGKGT